MRIAVLNHYAGSLEHGMVFRTWYIGREWARMGHRVDVYAASWSHLRMRNPDPGVRVQELAPGLTYHWVRTPRYEGNGLGRIVSMLQYSAATWLRAPGMAAGRPDAVVLSTPHPFAAWSATRIARLADAAFVFEVRDLWPRTLIELGGASAGHPFVRLMSAAERHACTHADLLASLLPGAWPHHEALGVDPSRYVVIPNGIDPQEWEERESAAEPDCPEARAVVERVRAFSRDGRVVVGYFGAHGLANALDGLLDAAARLRDRPIAFVLVGHGPDREALRARAVREGLDAVAFLDPVPKSRLGPAMRACDLLYAGSLDSPLYQYGASFNKLFDYLCAGRPVVLAARIAQDVVTASGAGVAVSPSDPGEVAAALDAMAALPAGERDRMGRRGRDYVLAHHAYPVLARRYADAIESAIARRAGARGPAQAASATTAAASRGPSDSTSR
jgi:glycosyltransferase involved in cell wall biosynthesis